MFKVVICDIQSSRLLKNRYAIQKKLIKTIKQCNILFKEWIICDFRITAGDEWEGLLTQDAKEEEILKFFKDQLPSYINFYTGIGIGSLSINDLSLPVNFLDGEAFINARENLKNNKKLKNIYS
ncbi:MAG: hypothetical protein E7214_09610 [Clostridium sp.]|nr:hypothetical protein [Clostridium sp.]